MVDRQARNQLLAIIDAYLMGNIHSFAFDEQVEALKTHDKTASIIAYQTWFFYDDIIDHPVKLTREQWGYFQRLRLILASNAEIKHQCNWHWSSRHTYAIIALTALSGIAWKFGFSETLFMANFVIGIITWIFMGWWPPSISPDSVDVYRVAPFQSLGTMRDVFESVNSFNKLPYPKEMNLKPLRAQWQVTSMMLPWIILSPIILPFIFLRIRSRKLIVVP